MKNKDKQIIEFIEYAKKRIMRSNSSRKDDWIDNITIYVCEHIETILSKKQPKLYLNTCIKYTNPIYSKHNKEIQIPVNEDGESLDDLFFVDNNTPDKEPETHRNTTVEQFKLAKKLIREILTYTTLRYPRKTNLGYIFYSKKYKIIESISAQRKGFAYHLYGKINNERMGFLKRSI